MKPVNNSFPNQSLSSKSNQSDLSGKTSSLNPRIYFVRKCPACQTEIFGMPGGADAYCHNCGYKDPCCGDY